MSAADVGVARLPLKEVSLLCQIGSDVSPESPLFVLVQGHRKDDTMSTFLVSVSHSGVAHSRRALSLEVKEIENELFAGVKNVDIKDVQYCGHTRQLVVHSAQEISVYRVQVAAGSMVAERRLTLAQTTDETNVVMVREGQVFIQEKDVVTAHGIEEGKVQVATGGEPTQSAAGSEKDQEEVRLPASTAIDPNTVSI